MAKLSEIVQTQGTQLSANLDAGIDTLSLQQEVTFVKYVRLILPLDGFAFWVRADTLSPSALLNNPLLNTVTPAERSEILAAAPTLTVKGSIHYATDTRQEEEETYSINQVVFSSEDGVTDLNVVGAVVLYLGTFDGVRFAFSSRGSFYKVADIYHYRGNAVYADMQTQIVDDPQQLDTHNIVVSNSLPIWLGLNGYTPPCDTGFGTITLPLYPSFLTPHNITPPFASVHIDPESTEAIGAAPLYDDTLSQTQLVKETVKITMYGMRNFNAMDFLSAVLQYSLDSGLFGVMNMPVIRDEKRNQTELQTLAQKKSVVLEVNYYQSRMRDVARRLIQSAFCTSTINDMN